MKYEQLKLDNQLCFPVYAASRLITREYKPLLDELGITYPQYLVMMVLWEQNNQSVNEISQKLLLNTNTVTPLLKRMEKQGFIVRNRSIDDERKVIISLSDRGKNLQELASAIPEKLGKKILEENFNMTELNLLKDHLVKLIDILSD